ncbi:MAG: TolC family protein [Myxococcota bacterium]
MIPSGLAFAVLIGAAPSADAASSAEVPVLTLDEAKQLARDNNVDIQIARERMLRASILSSKAWALLLPTISANTGITRFDKEIVLPFGLPEDLRPLFQSLGQPFPPPVNVTIQQQYQSNASARFAWVLLNGRSIPLIQNAYTSVEVAELSYDQAETALQFGTSLSYYAVLNAQEQAIIRRRALDMAREHMKLARAKVELGEATRVVSLRSEVEVAIAEQLVIQAENAARIARRGLATLIGKVDANGRSPNFRVTRPADGTAAPSGNLVEQAVTERLDLKSRHLELEMAERSKTESWMKFLPQLISTGSYRWSDVEGFSGEHTNWQLGLALHWTLFEGGLTYWELQERGHDINTAALMIEKTRRDIAQQVHDTRVDLESSRANQVAATRRVDLARKTAELVQAQFEVGAATQLDLLDANRVQADAETADALAQLGVDLARLSLEQVLLIPPPGVAASAAATPAMSAAGGATSATAAPSMDGAPGGGDMLPGMP